MKAVVQRVLRASVSVDGEIVGQCGRGMLLLVGVHTNDTRENAIKLAEKIARLRIFDDEAGKINLALNDLESQNKSQILAISNFTIYGDTTKNRRPSFIQSASYDQGLELFNCFVDALRNNDATVETGIFGAEMQVDLINHGPVTLIVEC